MFRLKENNTSFGRELIAGFTTFSAMAYILIVNANMFTIIDGAGLTYGAMYVSTALCSIVGSLLIGLMANLPLAQAPGMGLNAFFVYSICSQLHFTYANALAITLIDGVFFVILTVTGLRKLVFEAIPAAVKTAISAGIGLFIAFIGLQNVHFIVGSPSTLVNLHSLGLLMGRAAWVDVMPILVTIVTLALIGGLAQRGVKGAVFLGMLGGTALYYVLGFASIPGFALPTFSGSILQPFSDFVDQCLLSVFRKGFDFSSVISVHGVGGFVVIFFTSALSLCLVDMFDTMGTLYGACEVGGMLDEKGDVLNMNKAMLADALATCAGTILGNSTVSTFVESASGIAEGGRTGLTSVFTALFFLAAMLFAPIAMIIPGCATAAVLIYVGVLMMTNAGKVEWGKPEMAIPSFMTIAMISFTYNISYGIAFGIIFHILIQILSGKAKEIKLGTWILGAMFVLMFLLG